MNSIFGIPLPIENPVAIFLTVLLIILLAPLLMKRLHIPHIVGMILAGLVMGPYALNILPFDRSIDVFGKVGLYYIMFLAGMEIDLLDFKKNRVKALVFGLLSFSLPLVFGIVSSRYLLHYGLATSLLLASMYAAHTLVSFPIISRYGLGNKSVVNIAVGGTVIAVTLSLMILASVESFYNRGSGHIWIYLLLKFGIVLVVIFYLIPKLSAWFLKYYKDGILRFVFVLAMAFLGALLMEIVGFQGVLGAFFTGLALNRLVPKLSSLMNRVEFVGNALFFPYFLISIGMMINLRAFVQGWEAIYVALAMTGTVLLSKWLASKVMQWSFSMRQSEGEMLFGLTSGRAAVTLAVVMIGHQTVIGQTADGEPIRLLNDYVLNGSVVMILVSCLISSIVTENAAKKIMLEDAEKVEKKNRSMKGGILIPVANPRTIEHLIQLAVFLRYPQDKLYALSVVTDTPDADKEEHQRLLDATSQYASAIETELSQVLRYDEDLSRGISQTVREYDITDVVIGLHRKSQMSGSFFGEKTNLLLQMLSCNLYINRLYTPPSSIRRVFVILPEKAEYEQGFYMLIKRFVRFCENSGSSAVIYGHPTTFTHIKQIKLKQKANLVWEYNELVDLKNILALADIIRSEDMLVVVMSREEGVSYNPIFTELPQMLETAFPKRSLSFVYPAQTRFVQNITSYSGPVNMPVPNKNETGSIS